MRYQWRFEREIFNRVFSVGWFMAAIAAIYANFLNDPGQNASDAASFFELAKGEFSGLGLDEVRAFTEGAGAVMLWRAVYDGFAFVGFEKGRYIGVLINVLAVSFTAVISVKMARLIYGDDARRARQLGLMFSLCGMFWLFSGVHLRDAVVLLAVTITTYSWVRYFANNEGRGIVLLAAVNVSMFFVLALLRTEFAFVPAAMFLSAVVVQIIQEKHNTQRAVGAFFIYLVALAGLIVLYVVLRDDALFSLIRGYEGYSEASVEQSGADSLGVAFVVNQVLPVRLVVGAAYLFVFPIPFWTGFQLESVSYLFKSFNALFFYFFIPLLVLSLIRFYQSKTLRNPALTFLLFVSVGFTLAIAGTSLETRHFGAFLVPYFLFSLLPNMRLKSERYAYSVGILLSLGAVSLMHLAWTSLKFLP